MDYLLDTCIALWWLSEPKKLNKKTHQIISDGENKIWFSVASIWELAIKIKLNRVEIPHHFFNTLETEQISILSIEASHVLATIDLPMIHQDPFDRLLIAQTKCESMTLITKDAVIIKYPIACLSA